MYKKVMIVSSAPITIERPISPLALLAGICEEKNVDYEVFDLNIFLYYYFSYDEYSRIVDTMLAYDDIDLCPNEELKQKVNYAISLAIDEILKQNFDLLALTVFSAMQFSWTKKFLKEFRKRSNITIIAGGPGISIKYKNEDSAGKILASENLIDYYVRGEGDFAFGNFLDGKVDLGVNDKNQLTDYWVPQIDDLSKVPLPSYKKIPLDKYKSHLTNISDNSIELLINGSRGCVRRCTFCDVGAIWKKYRYRPAQSIADEMIKNYVDVGCVAYTFSDSLINGSLKQFTELLEKIIDLQNIYPAFKNLKFSGPFIIRPKQFHSEKMFELMKKAGCDSLQVGIESGSEKVREHMGKKFSDEDIDYHFEMCSKYKIKNHLLMFTAYVTETEKDHQDTINFFIKNQKYLIDNTIIGTNLNSPLIIIKDTPLYEMRNELGLHLNEESSLNFNWTSEINPELTNKIKWRRFVELIELTTKLKYKRAEMDLIYIEQSLLQILKLEKEI